MARCHANKHKEALFRTLTLDALITRFLSQVVSSYIQNEFASVRTSNSILDLFRTPGIRKVTCCLMMVW